MPGGFFWFVQLSAKSGARASETRTRCRSAPAMMPPRSRCQRSAELNCAGENASNEGQSGTWVTNYFRLPASGDSLVTNRVSASSINPDSVNSFDKRAGNFTVRVVARSASPSL